MFNIIMKELTFLDIINRTLCDNSLLGEDCAYLEDFGLFITQDTLCENVHFDLKYTDFYTLAKKAVGVNISDLCANLSEPKYISVSFSAPKNINTYDIENFYRGIEDCCKKYNIKVSGGDLTGSKEGVVISICAIGKPINTSKKVSRGYARENQVVCVTKDYGSSAYALYCMQNNIKCSKKLLKTHFEPEPDIEVSKILASQNCKEIAIMDSSDGLCDALFKLAKTSNKSIEIDFSKIPYNNEIENCKGFKDLIFWGGEDYGLVFCIDEKEYEIISKKLPKIKKIGVVKPFNKDFYVKIDDLEIDEKTFLKKSYNHFD